MTPQPTADPDFIPAQAASPTPAPAPASGGDDPDFIPAQAAPASTQQPQSTMGRAWQGMKQLDPNVGLISGAIKEAQKHIAGAVDMFDKYVIAPNDPGATDMTQRAHQAAHQTAEWLRKNTDEDSLLEKGGGFGESTAELLAPETWGGKAVEGMGYADRLYAMAKNAKILEGNPGLLKTIKLGLSAAKTAAEAATTGAKMGTQAFVESGGDPQTAEDAALTGAATHGVLATGAGALEATADAVANKVASVKAATAAADSAPARFGNSATDVLQSAFDRLGVPDKAPPVADYGQAADRLGEKAADIYDAADQATEGRWRTANAAIQAAKGTGNKAAETAARADMEKLVSGFDDTGYGQLVREATDRARDAFHDHYTLDTIHNGLVKAFDFGTPETAAMQGGKNTFNGSELRKQLTNLERNPDVGRDRMVELMGEDGLKSLYDLSDTANNPAQNQKITQIMQEIASRAHAKGSKAAWASGMLGTFLPSGWAKTAGAGYAAGSLLGAGEVTADKLLSYAATKPAIVKLINYAAKHNVSTKYAATLTGEALRMASEKDQQQPPTQETPQQ